MRPRPASRTQSSGLTVADVVLFLAVVLLAAAVLIPGYFYNTLGNNEKDVRESLKHLVELQRSYSTGRYPLEYADRLSKLQAFNAEPRFGGIFDGEQFGYLYSIGAITAQKMPLFYADGNNVLAQITDLNTALALRERRDEEYRALFVELVERRLAALEADPNATLAPAETSPEQERYLVGLPWSRVRQLLKLPVEAEETTEQTEETEEGTEPVEPDANAVVLTAEDLFYLDVNRSLTAGRMLWEVADLNFTFAGKTTWSAEARPLQPGFTGIRSFFIDESGLVRGEDIAGQPGHFGMGKLE